MKNVAVIGLGNIATRHRRNLKQLFPQATLFAMSASGRIPVDAVTDCDYITASIDELIDSKIELAIIASPATLHAQHAIPLIKAGIPTLIEKPVVADVKDIAALQNIIKATKTPVAIGYCLRYLPSGLKVKDILAQKKLGTLYNAFIQIGQYLPDWRPNKDYRDSVSANKHLGGGALLELSHELDYAQWLLGDLTVEHAILRSSKELGLDVEDMADIILRTEQGVINNIHLDFLQRSVQRNCSLLGSGGRLEWNLIENSVIFYGSEGTEVIYSEPEWDKNKMYLAMLEDFVGMIHGKPHQCVELSVAVKTVQLIDTIKVKNNWNNEWHI